MDIMQLIKSSWVVLLIITVLSSIAMGADAPPGLAKQVQGIFKAHCFKCHGEGGANEGGFNFVLNRERLVGKFVVAGKPGKVKLKMSVGLLIRMAVAAETLGSLAASPTKRAEIG